MIESYNQSTDNERRLHIKYCYEYVNVIIKVLIMSKGYNQSTYNKGRKS